MLVASCCYFTLTWVLLQLFPYPPHTSWCRLRPDWRRSQPSPGFSPVPEAASLSFVFPIQLPCVLSAVFASGSHEAFTPKASVLRPGLWRALWHLPAPRMSPCRAGVGLAAGPFVARQKPLRATEFLYPQSQAKLSWVLIRFLYPAVSQSCVVLPEEDGLSLTPSCMEYVSAEPLSTVLRSLPLPCFCFLPALGSR